MPTACNALDLRMVVAQLTEALDSEDRREQEAQERAEQYFSIGQDEDVGYGVCWFWDGFKLRTSAGDGSHSTHFGQIVNQMMDNPRSGALKGWYNPNSKKVSVVFPEGGKTVDDIPQRAWEALRREFPKTHFVIF